MLGSLLKTLAIPALAVVLYAAPDVPRAQAEPAGFPDLTAFTEAPANMHFSRPDKWASGYAFFRTPDGLNCMSGSIVRCSGALPGLSTAEYGDCAEVFQTYDAASRGEPFTFGRTSDCDDAPDELLDVGQKLTFTTNSTTTCVVGRDRLTACIRGDHGFVLQPSGSWVF